MAQTYRALETGQTVLAASMATETTDPKHLYELGQLFNDVSGKASVRLSEVQFLTAHLPFSASLEATRQRLAEARTHTGAFFNSTPSAGDERDQEYATARGLWQEVVVGLNDVRAVAYCELLLGDEEPGDARDACPITPQVRPTPPPG